MAESIPTSATSQEKVDELAKAAALQYSLKNFADAAELYSKASEIQGELNGEMAPENADLLYYYGRALFKVAIATSDVLGGKVAQEEKKKPKVEREGKKEPAAVASSSSANGAKTEEEAFSSKPYFQLTGDENWTDSEDEEEEAAEAEGGAEADEEQDDFGNAFQALDMARVLYLKRLETLEGEKGADKEKGKAEISLEGKEVRERLANCYHFLVEIAFENERFHDAIPDARSALELQQEIFESYHPHVTEAHYKLSLALEFASVSNIRTDLGGPTDAEQQGGEVDFELRKEATQQMELAVQSLKEQIKRVEAKPTQVNNDKEMQAADLKELREMLEEMENHLAELKQDPNQTFDAAQGIDASVLQGVLSGILGADPSAQKAKLEEATRSANDISGLVKTKKKEKASVAAQAVAPVTESSGKRKLEVDDRKQDGKRAKTEED
ncbi:hypothetical protein CC78DRAFT_538339 [Lojkania enalia]|uniref:Tetratricopeptide SHNi-TPR domain-containing protein n=1 Tax=Lojkania enalia TaxID=147567 RepID=A0A9P4JWG8_9PLEO|nr:hypothetical protein CC78DRAFT_538339 [Didymosphaeria enalia]